MDEMFKYQKMIEDSILEENGKFEMLDEQLNLSHAISKAKEYHSKLINLKKIHEFNQDRLDKLKLRATKLKDDKLQADEEKRKARERRKIIEKHLEPVVNTKK